MLAKVPMEAHCVEHRHCLDRADKTDPQNTQAINMQNAKRGLTRHAFREHTNNTQQPFTRTHKLAHTLALSEARSHARKAICGAQEFVRTYT